MTILRNLVADLREKRLWPLAVVLLLGIVAVPVLLASGSSPAVPAATGAGLGSATPNTPAIGVSATPTRTRLTGRARNPFTGSGKNTTTTTTSTPAATGSTTTTTASSGTSSASSTGSGATGSSTATGGSGTTGASGTSPTLPATKPKPAPAGLTPTETYAVSLSLTTNAGGVDDVSPLERLSVVPSSFEPFLVELGVLRGGRRVLFSVRPGTKLVGPATCIPGPVDCEVVSLAPGEVEEVAGKSTAGTVKFAAFSVSGVTVVHHASRSAADAARTRASTAGRSLLADGPTGSLSLFPYEPDLGVVVDERNLTVGGN